MKRNRKALLIKKVHEIAYHRNGICGAPFYVVTFRSSDPMDAEMVGIVFDEKQHVAVFEREKLGAGLISFGVNSYRGDRFETELRAAIRRSNGEEAI